MQPFASNMAQQPSLRDPMHDAPSDEEPNDAAPRRTRERIVALASLQRTPSRAPVAGRSISERRAVRTAVVTTPGGSISSLSPLDQPVGKQARRELSHTADRTVAIPFGAASSSALQPHRPLQPLVYGAPGYDPAQDLLVQTGGDVRKALDAAFGAETRAVQTIAKCQADFREAQAHTSSITSEQVAAERKRITQLAQSWGEQEREACLASVARQQQAMA